MKRPNKSFMSSRFMVVTEENEREGEGFLVGIPTAVGIYVGKEGGKLVRISCYLSRV